MAEPLYWLVKSDPKSYSWQDFVAEGGTYWDGVRNHQAKNNLARMSPGEHVLFYHSIQGKSVMGVAEVTAAAYPDPTDESGRWVAVDLRPVTPMARPVPLREIKADPLLADCPLVRQSRLSVMELSEQQAYRILELGGLGAPTG